MNGYVDLDGHSTWVEDDEGPGEPVVLLHGGFSDSSLLAGTIAPSLAGAFRIVSFDRRGHGRTADTDAEFHYESMAAETRAVLEQVTRSPAHLVGYSDGANVALLTARLVPELVRSLVLISGNFHADGLVPDPLPFEPGSLSWEISAAGHAALSPDGPEHFPTVAGKTLRMFAAEPDLTVDDLRAIHQSALVIAADDDLVELDHTVELYRSLPNSRLAIVPGTSHALVLEKPAAVSGLVAEFLAAPGADDVLARAARPVRRRARGAGDPTGIAMSASEEPVSRVGEGGLEPPTSCTQSRCATTALLPGGPRS